MQSYMFSDSNAYAAEIFCVYSNHERASNTHVMRFLERHGIPYHYVSTTKENKKEDEILELVKDTDFVVLARYMQVNQIFSPCIISFLSFFDQMFSNNHVQPSDEYYCVQLSFFFPFPSSNSFINRIEFITFSFWQILSGNFLKGYGKDVINIHHGLLPSFKGGNPAKQVTDFLSWFYPLLVGYILLPLNILDFVCRHLMQV